MQIRPSPLFWTTSCLDHKIERDKYIKGALKGDTRAHDSLHDSVLPLEIQLAAAPSLPTIMSTQQSNGLAVPLPEINPFKFDQSFLQRLKRIPNEFKEFFEHIKFSILLPLSWFLTMFKFCRTLIWRFLTMPLRLFINFYERRVRERFTWLPSIWGTLFYLFPGGIKFPTFTSLTAGPYKGAGPIGKNPTVDVDLNAIIMGNQPNGTNGAVGDHSGSVENGSDNPLSQVNTHRSKLETTLKNIITFSPADLDTGLWKVKAAQAEAENSLKLTGSE